MPKEARSGPGPRTNSSQKPKKRGRGKALTSLPTNLCPQGYTAFLSADWADQAHDIRLWDPNTGAVSAHQIGSRPEDLQPFLLNLIAQHPGGKIGVFVESHSGSFVNQVRGFDALVLHQINPKSAAKYRESLHPSGAKSDPIDADMILRFGLTHLDIFPAQAPDTDATRRLKFLTEARRQLVDLRTGEINRLTALLKAIYPQVLDLFDELTSPMALDFMKKYSTCQGMQQAPESQLTKFFHEHNSRSKARMQKRLQIISQSQALSQDPVVIECLTARILASVDILQAYGKHIKLYDEQLAKHTQAHPDYAIFKSVPGAGACLIPRLIALFGTDRSRWADAVSILSFVGVAPIIKSSGETTSVHHRTACPRFLRQTLIELASTSHKEECPWVVEFCQSRKKLGWRYPRILRAVAFKWGRILWRIWQNRSSYSEERRQHPGMKATATADTSCSNQPIQPEAKANE